MCKTDCLLRFAPIRECRLAPIRRSEETPNLERFPLHGMFQAGFNLIELLVVIGIIAILASLLLPSLSRAKEAARAAKCRSNLHQMGLALELYVQDNGAYPLAGSHFNHVLKAWDESLVPYTSSHWSSPLYRCPSYKGKTTPDAVAQTIDFLTYRFGSYAYNADGSHLTGGLLGLGFNMEELEAAHFRPEWIVREAAVQAPSEMAAIGDAPIWERPATEELGGFFTLDWQFGRIMTYNKAPARMLKAVRQRHRDRYTVVFCDAHVEAVPRPVLFGIAETSTQRLNRNHQPYLMDLWTLSYTGD